MKPSQVIDLLVSIRNKTNFSDEFDIDDELISEIYEIELRHQFRTDRSSVHQKLEKIVENYLNQQ